jgi:hypothetical protein
MTPLLSLAHSVDGIDASPEMVAIAAAKGLKARVADLRAVESNAYDLISMCMAFHWFERDEAVGAMTAASAAEATWVIYNFWFAGHNTEEKFNLWLRGWYREQFPSPARSATSFIPKPEDGDIELLAHTSGTLHVPFDRPALIGYLTTQSNVEARLAANLQYAEAEKLIDSTMPSVGDPSAYLYGYEYSISYVRRALNLNP